MDRFGLPTKENKRKILAVDNVTGDQFGNCNM